MSDLAASDLNPLRVFGAAARGRPVTRRRPAAPVAAGDVRCAGCLRAALGDALLPRAPGGVEPTTLAQPVSEGLDRSRGTPEARLPFPPAIAARMFPVAMSEHAEAVLAPPLPEHTGRAPRRTGWRRGRCRPPARGCR